MSKYKEQRARFSVHHLRWVEPGEVGVLWLGSFSEKRIKFQALKKALEFGTCPRPISWGKDG